jgi:hypothetical protein
MFIAAAIIIVFALIPTFLVVKELKKEKLNNEQKETI